MGFLIVCAFGIAIMCGLEPKKVDPKKYWINEYVLAGSDEVRINLFITACEILKLEGDEEQELFAEECEDALWEFSQQI